MESLEFITVVAQFLWILWVLFVHEFISPMNYQSQSLFIICKTESP